MSASDIIEEMKKLPTEERNRVLHFFRSGYEGMTPQPEDSRHKTIELSDKATQRVSAGPSRYMDTDEVIALSKEVFKTNAELFRKLAQ